MTTLQHATCLRCKVLVAGAVEAVAAARCRRQAIKAWIQEPPPLLQHKNKNKGHRQQLCTHIKDSAALQLDHHA